MKLSSSLFIDQNTNYNDIARKYNILEKNAVTLLQLGYPYVIKYLNPGRDKSVLDYGCGSGTFCRLLHRYNFKVTGVDISGNMIKVAKESQPDDIDYFHITSGNLDFLSESSFDYASSNFVLCTIPSRRKIKKIISAVFRILKKDGVFIIMNANWEKSNGKEFISFKLKYCNKLSSGNPVKAIIKTCPPIVLNDYYWSKTDYVQLLEESGFKIYAIEEPLAMDDSNSWISEKTNPPYEIIFAKK
jgi:ubiquinone/menaquinone biosynthesis C-methylase UbiE